MNCKMPLAALVFGILALPGCAVRHPAAFRTVLEPSCLVAPIVIENCSAASDSVSCRKVKLRYKRGCEKIEVIKAKK